MISSTSTASTSTAAPAAPSFSLNQALAAFGGDQPGQIPWLVRLFENPASPLPFPAKIDLYAHDCLHVLFSRGMSLEDEAFVVGFTLGNDDRTQSWHVALFKFVSSHLYPAPYRFRKEDWPAFDWGVRCGRAAPIRNMNRLNFQYYQGQPVSLLRRWFGLDQLLDGEGNV
jgi:hypothetical protein